MNRDLDAGARERAEARIVDPQHQTALARDERSREPLSLRVRGSVYRLSPGQLDAMNDVGRFRTVAVDDLQHVRYAGRAPDMRQDTRALAAQGLLQERQVWTGPGKPPLRVLVLTKRGRQVLEGHLPGSSGQGGLPDKQELDPGFVKPHEVRHDAAIYRMFQAERERIERAGGRVRRVILDFELKRRVYTPLAKTRAEAPAEYTRRQEEVARQNGLKVVAGKIPLPDLRLEFETRTGEMARVDLELATAHYHGPALAAKAQAGFTFYAADGSSARLSRVLEERDITVAILSI